MITEQLNTVTPLRRSYRTQLKGAEAAMSTIRWEMHNHYPRDLADEVGCSVSCIYAIRSGRTKWPRHHTFFRLCDYLGLKLYLEKSK